MKPHLMKIGSRLKYCLFILAIVQLFSCARLPEYARPQFNPEGYSLEAKARGFSYRKLAVQDFQAKSPPTSATEQNDHLQARSCLSIRPSSDIRAHVSRSSMNGKVFYIGNISDVRFEAQFLPHCSWWNPKVTQKKKAYVLQHEQIHFAIAELEARELTRKAGAKIKEYLAFGDTRDDVKKELSEKLQNIASESTKKSLEEHLSFDNDTSMTFAPKVQKQWLEKVESEIYGTKPEK